jgi:hypothetical protein
LGVGPFLYGDVPEEEGEERIAPFFGDPDPAGLVVVSQTCDIISDPGRSPMVAVCPLVAVDKRRLDEIARGGAPRFGFVEHAPEGLVADFSRVMSISKQLLFGWVRQAGFSDQARALNFARGLERAYGRFAFPDAFNESIRPLEGKIKSKYGKPESPLGKAVRSLAELRVRPSAKWDGREVPVAFLLIFAPADKRVLAPLQIKEEFEKALKDLPWQGGFGLADPSVRIGDYEDFTARDYIESVPLDLNALSFAARYRRATGAVETMVSMPIDRQDTLE